MTWPKSLYCQHLVFLGRSLAACGVQLPQHGPPSWDRRGWSPGPLEGRPSPSGTGHIREQQGGEAAGMWQRWYGQERGLTEDSHTPCSASNRGGPGVHSPGLYCSPLPLLSQPAATPQRQMCLHHPSSGQQHWGRWRHAHALHMSTCIYFILTDFRTMSKEFIKWNGKSSHTHL